jgi:hypothetical protein
VVRTMHATSRKRGRPTHFTQDERVYLANLIRVFGIRGTGRVSTIPACQQTLCKIAAEFGITLKKGKRRKIGD